MITLALLCTLASQQDTSWTDYERACTVLVRASLKEHDPRLGTGFLWKDGKHVATAYHVIAGAEEVNVYAHYPKLQSRTASVYALNRDSDVVVLELEGDALCDRVLPIGRLEFQEAEPLYVVGYPNGIEFSDRQKALPRHSSASLPTIADLATRKIKQSLKEMGYPRAGLRVVNLDGNIMLGHSGAPLMKNQQVIGLVQGGLADGEFGRSWAVPIEEVEKAKPVSRDYVETNIAEYRKVSAGFATLTEESVDPTVPVGWDSLTDQYDLGWAKRARDRSTDIVFVLIPPGIFRMGSKDTEGGERDEEPIRDVVITQPFYMSETEVTRLQWAVICGNPFAGRYASFPQVDVSWGEVRQRIQQFGYQLPTEAQWEYACRADTTTPFSVGKRIHASQANFSVADSTERYTWGGTSVWAATAVRTYAVNPWGLYDMHGNVWELCEDTWSDRGYKMRYSTNPVGVAEGFGMTGAKQAPLCTEDPLFNMSGATVVRRGGAWNTGASHCRSANRGRIERDAGDSVTGFRVVVSPRRPEFYD